MSELVNALLTIEHLVITVDEDVRGDVVSLVESVLGKPGDPRRGDGGTAPPTSEAQCGAIRADGKPCTRPMSHNLEAIVQHQWDPTKERASGEAPTGPDGLTSAESHCATCVRCQTYRKMAEDEVRRLGAELEKLRAEKSERHQKAFEAVRASGEASTWPPKVGDRFLVEMFVVSFGEGREREGDGKRWLRLDAVNHPYTHGTFAPEELTPCARSARPDRCTVPPAGWSCSRVAGHTGPCAASPTGSGR